MAYGVAGLGRFRVNVFQQRGNVGMVLRVIPPKFAPSKNSNCREFSPPFAKSSAA
jgi:twitching motility protein PilT